MARSLPREGACRAHTSPGKASRGSPACPPSASLLGWCWTAGQGKPTSWIWRLRAPPALAWHGPGLARTRGPRPEASVRLTALDYPPKAAERQRFVSSKLPPLEYLLLHTLRSNPAAAMQRGAGDDPIATPGWLGGQVKSSGSAPASGAQISRTRIKIYDVVVKFNTCDENRDPTFAYLYP